MVTQMASAEHGWGNTMIFLTCTLGFLMWLDVITTEAALRLGYSEQNPLMVSVAGNPFLHLLVKTAALAIIVFLATRCEKRIATSGTHMLTVLAGFYLAVLINNLLYLYG
jgi:hypothetical protein